MWEPFTSTVDRLEVPGGNLYRYVPTGSIAFAPTVEAIGVEDVYALVNGLGTSLQDVVERLDSVGDMLNRRTR